MCIHTYTRKVVRVGKRINIYIPAELIELWEQIENKSQFVQEAIKKEANV